MRKFFLLLTLICSFSSYSQIRQELTDSLNAFAKRRAVVNRIGITRLSYNSGVISLTANDHLACVPWRKADVDSLKQIVRQVYGAQSNVRVCIYSGGVELEKLTLSETERPWGNYTRPYVQPWVTQLDKPFAVDSGMAGKHIALWASHGYHYDHKTNRWKWQRARLLQTVEDLYTSSYTIPFLVPMLERAGAYVVQPRERDIQTHEVIVDNDHAYKNGRYQQGSRWERGNGGFALQQNILTGTDNPFHMGSHAFAESTTDSAHLSEIVWQPKIPADGQYAVYISYQTQSNSTSEAHYEVLHAGGCTRFVVNQQMGGGTWVYLGTFPFKQGTQPNGMVRLTNYSTSEGVITSDAVRFGGGMGNIARGINTLTHDAYTCFDDTTAFVSQRPRWMEGARYYLQWSGMPDSVYMYKQPKDQAYKPNDYIDDLSCRGKWVNYLSGGSVVNPDNRGLNVPIDLAIALHSDAGVTPTDSIIGTLCIYTSKNDDKKSIYPTGTSRYIARELADRIQSQIVDDIRRTVAPEWQRRSMYDKSYSETRVPEVPAVIIELLSHQNFADMLYGQDPAFRFMVSRSIYKGILKYLHAQDQSAYCVQPLPISHFAIHKKEDNKVLLTWKAVTDSLEPTATAKGFVLYTRRGEGGFDNGQYISSDSCLLNLQPGEHYTFKVTAVNEGGESLDSECLSAYIHPKAKGCALIINGFEKTSGPDWFSIDSTYAGFYGNQMGIPYLYDISYVGAQHEFRKNVPWMHDDAPGFGASYADYEHMSIKGNTFDYPLVHGKSFAKAGYSYVSCSVASVDTNTYVGYRLVDYILGRQAHKTTGMHKRNEQYACFPDAMLNYLQRHANNGGDIIVSGAHVGSDVWEHASTYKRKRIEQLLHYQWRTANASNCGQVKTSTSVFKEFDNRRKNYSYYHQPNAHNYHVCNVDAIEPYGQGACTIMRYADNQISAATAYRGRNYRCCIFGFPIECLTSQTEIDDILSRIIRFFEQ